jgi:hypothetical protein
MNWFEIDKLGLSKIVSRKPKYFVIFELLQNAWDENSTNVKLNIYKEKNSKLATISIEDDNPEGFLNLEHSFTLFAESNKKSNPQKRGRFNLGEKLVLSLCHEAKIESTKGTIIFNQVGRKKSKKRRDFGTLFVAKIKMTNLEIDDAIEAINILIPPENIKTYINGELVNSKKPIKTFNTQLPTEISDEEGFLRKSKRYTDVEVYSASENSGWIYEMGIPVVQTGDTYSINVLQKVPLNMERDNVNRSYLKQLRTKVLEEMISIMEDDDSTANWVNDALENKDISSITVTELVKKRYGDKVVAFDPSDSEANKLAVTNGYVVIHGRNLNKEQWKNIKKSEAILPAGQVTPSPKPFSDDLDAKQLIIINNRDLNPKEKEIIDLLENLSKKIIGRKVSIIIANDKEWGFNGSFCKSSSRMIINKASYIHNWIDKGINTQILSLFIHELGHHYASDHLSSEYYKALSDIGAKIALNNPFQ